MRGARLGPMSAAIAAALFIAVPAMARAEDDWEVIERHTTEQRSDERSHDSAAGGSESAKSAEPKIVTVCGEPARPATEPYTSVVKQLEDMYGVTYPLYESTRVISPHATQGGCIFYNRKFLDQLLGDWMRVNDTTEQPMLYAIFAHELGHLVHGDVSSDSHGPVKTKELAADQFAGYTVERLGLRRLDPDEVTKYYQLTGDDFFGPGGDHGSGQERTDAFLDGWHRAEIGLPETSSRPAGGLGQP